MRLLRLRVPCKDRRLLLCLSTSALLLLLLLLYYAREATVPSRLQPALGGVVLEPSTGLLDVSGRYSVHTFVVEGNKWRSLAGRSATIATHCSLDHLHWVVDTAAGWAGPISVAVFAPDAAELQLAACYVDYLRRCHTVVRDQVSFHVVRPVDMPARLPDECPWQAMDCDAATPREVLLHLRDNASRALVYPQNTLRNVAYRTSPTRYVLAADVDMIFPSREMSAQLEHFLGRRRRGDDSPRSAFVLPVYEVADDVPAPPANKTALLELVAAKRARRFHVDVFPENQRKSDLARWERTPQAPHVAVSYPVRNYQFWYEPVYVSERTVPTYDERFIGYGTTRNTQVYEMFLAGWTFEVLNNVFLIHWGFQSRSNYPKWRRGQQQDNIGRFKVFVREMAVRYDKDPLGLLAQFPRTNSKMAVVRANVGARPASAQRPAAKLQAPPPPSPRRSGHLSRAYTTVTRT